MERPVLPASPIFSFDETKSFSFTSIFERWQYFVKKSFECSIIIYFPYIISNPVSAILPGQAAVISLPENLSTAEKIPVLMAGFTVNFLLAVMFFVLKKPLFGYINLIIGIFTALPVPSADGGEVLKAVIEEFLPNKAEKIFGIVSRIFVSIISLLLFLVSVLTENYFILIAVIYMVFCVIKKAAR